MLGAAAVRGALDWNRRTADGIRRPRFAIHDFPNRSHRMIGLPARVGSSVSEMPTGVVLLSVPLLDDVIQVGTAGGWATGTIEVAKTPSEMVVRRSDGRPLQAHILRQSGEGSASRTPVFREPVRSLRLRCVPHAGASERWIVLPGVRIRRHTDLFQLIETIAAFGLAKQQVCLRLRSRRQIARPLF